MYRAISPPSRGCSTKILQLAKFLPHTWSDGYGNVCFCFIGGLIQAANRMVISCSCENTRSYLFLGSQGTEGCRCMMKVHLHSWAILMQKTVVTVRKESKCIKSPKVRTESCIFIRLIHSKSRALVSTVVLLVTSLVHHDSLGFVDFCAASGDAFAGCCTGIPKVPMWWRGLLWRWEVFIGLYVSKDQWW